MSIYIFSRQNAFPSFFCIFFKKLCIFATYWMAGSKKVAGGYDGTIWSFSANPHLPSS